MQIKVYENYQKLIRAAAEEFVRLSEKSIRARGIFSVALTGGSTPLGVYGLLATHSFNQRVDWRNVHLFWGDERFVPWDHPDSNYNSAKETLLDHIAIPEGNVHPFRTDLTAAEAADLYSSELDRLLGSSPEFDLVFLGMGADGHTASLFPGSEAIFEKQKTVTAHYVKSIRAWRLTLTPVVLNRAAAIIFLVSGSPKANTLRRVLEGSFEPTLYPAQIIQPENGDLLWMFDQPAAELLGPDGNIVKY